MAIFAKLDSDNNVLSTSVVSDSVLMDSNNNLREELGVAFLIQWSGGHPFWKLTSPENSFRKNYAGIGYTYDANLDAFIPPQPYPSWQLNTETCLWDPPTLMPDDGQRYWWDEDTQSWILVEMT